MAGAKPARKPQERRDRSADVLEAAIHVFYSKGYADASMRDVADRVGLLKGSLYHYISSKEELLFTVLSKSHDEAVEIMDRVEQVDGRADERLALYLSLMSSWYLANVERVSIYFREGGHLSGARAKAVRVQRKDALAFLCRLLEDAKDEGLVRPDVDTTLASLMIFGQLNSVPDWYKRQGPYKPAVVTRAFVKAVLCSLSSPSPALLAVLDDEEAGPDGPNAQWSSSGR
ncbi:MAG: TetR/AcrR family transcriptional regulator [Frankiales bacterium]|nr:TetR/AcrR family transcriptional regulator [Frankiales bacterium]